MPAVIRISTIRNHARECQFSTHDAAHYHAHDRTHTFASVWCFFIVYLTQKSTHQKNSSDSMCTITRARDLDARACTNEPAQLAVRQGLNCFACARARGTYTQVCIFAHSHGGGVGGGHTSSHVLNIVTRALCAAVRCEWLIICAGVCARAPRRFVFV